MRVPRLFVTVCGSGFAPTFWLLMVGRVVSGIGGGGIMPLTTIIITGGNPLLPSSEDPYQTYRCNTKETCRILERLYKHRRHYWTGTWRASGRISCRHNRMEMVSISYMLSMGQLSPHSCQVFPRTVSRDCARHGFSCLEATIDGSVRSAENDHQQN